MTGRFIWELQLSGGPADRKSIVQSPIADQHLQFLRDHCSSSQLVSAQPALRLAAFETPRQRLSLLFAIRELGSN